MLTNYQASSASAMAGHPQHQSPFGVGGGGLGGLGGLLRMSPPPPALGTAGGGDGGACGCRSCGSGAGGLGGVSAMMPAAAFLAEAQQRVGFGGVGAGCSNFAAAAAALLPAATVAAAAATAGSGPSAGHGNHSGHGGHLGTSVSVGTAAAAAAAAAVAATASGASSRQLAAPLRDALPSGPVVPKAKKDAEERAEAERSRCHLHKKSKQGCKFCQRHVEFVNKGKEEKAAAREKFISDVKGKDKAANGNVSSREFAPGHLELSNTKSFNFTALLHSHIVESTHFKTLMTLESFEEIVDEIHNYADTVEPYMHNSGTVPSALFCCVLRLFTMGLDRRQLVQLVEHESGALVRCAGFLYIRFGLASDMLWPWLGEYVLDDEEFLTSKDAETPTTIGEYVESLLTMERYFSTVLPRLPMTTKRQLEVKLAEVPQFRKRAQANIRILDTYRQKGVEVEACSKDGEWHSGEVTELLEASGSRLKVRVRFDGQEREEAVHIGKVILTDSRHQSLQGYHRARRRSRSRSSSGVDWARHKGKTGVELVEELRRREQDRAVCTSGKEYARRPVSFKVALPMEQGSASHKLAQDETYVQPSKRSEARDRSRSPEWGSRRDREQSEEYKARMKQVFEKYSTPKGQEESRQSKDIEGPDTLRLG
eukprot:TRINITY_DN8720_c1_g1_i1.p1 TRINITY_DN8720_c1_g1~~TRINITY_DN8720_c1_g1_i1.p1  ORF type:complete len:685 (-),score=145.24 TRINITY_DN8720_c1_g1_i1:138-2096(-)